MRKVYLSALKDIRFNKSRSFVIVLAITMVISFPLAFMNLPYNLENVITEEQEDYNLAHMAIYFLTPQGNDIKTEISDEIASYLDISDDDFLVDTRLHRFGKYQSQGGGNIANGSWINMEMMGYDNLPQISQLEFIKGNYPNTTDGIAILESLAREDNLTIGDEITIYGSTGPINRTIVGLVGAIEYSSFALSQTGAGFMTIESMSEIFDYDIDQATADRYNSFPVFFVDNIELSTLRDLYDYLIEHFNEDNSLPNIWLIWFVRETSYRKSLLDALNLTARYLNLASLFIFFVAAVIIFVVMNRYVNEQKRTLGAIYSYGIRRRDILYSYFLKILVLSTFASILGYLLAKFMLQQLMVQMTDSWGLLSIKTEFSGGSLIYTGLSSVVVSYSSTFIAVVNLLRLTPYEAMRGKTTELKNEGWLFRLANGMPTKLLRTIFKNYTRNRTRSILTVIALASALTFSLSLTYTNDSLFYTIDDFYENHLYFDIDVELQNFEDIRDPGLLQRIISVEGIVDFEPFMSALVQLVDRPEVATFAMAVPHNSTMFDVNTVLEGETIREGESGVVISQYLAGTEGYEVGDQFNFSMVGIKIPATVVGIANDLYASTSFLVDLGYVSDYFFDLVGISPDSGFWPYDFPYVFNRILLKTDPNADIKEIENRLNTDFPEINVAFSADFYQNRTTTLVTSQSQIILLMVFLGLIVGMVSVLTTLLIAIIEREKELALLQIFGYKKSTLFTNILLEGLVLGMISLLPAYIIGRLIAQYMWMPIVEDLVFKMKPFFNPQIDLLMLYFLVGSIIISVIPSFRAATTRKLAEIIREE